MLSEKQTYLCRGLRCLLGLQEDFLEEAVQDIVPLLLVGIKSLADILDLGFRDLPDLGETVLQRLELLFIVQLCEVSVLRALVQQRSVLAIQLPKLTPCRLQLYLLLLHGVRQKCFVPVCDLPGVLFDRGYLQVLCC